MNAGQGQQKGSLRDELLGSTHSVRETCCTSVRFGWKNTASSYNPEVQTSEVNVPRPKPVLEGPWFSLRS